MHGSTESLGGGEGDGIGLQHLRGRFACGRDRHDCHGRAHHSARLCVYGRALRPLFAHPRAGARAHRSLCRAHRPQGERHGAGRRRAEPGGVHPRQCRRHHRRGGLLPGARSGPRLLRGLEPAAGAAHADHDEHPHRRRLDGSRPAPLPSRRDQRAPAPGPRCRGFALGPEGHPHRDQGHPAAASTSPAPWRGR